MPYHYLVTSFHSRAVVGLNTCLKKQMIATCSVDRSLRLWSHEIRTNRFSLKTCQTFEEEPLALALHPSGFQIIVSTPDHIKMMNILDNKIETYKELPVKSCKVIEFSHGGHYFAVQSGSFVIVYKFYTAESPPEFCFQGHSGNVIGIIWFDDDTGFATIGVDCQILLFKLY